MPTIDQAKAMAKRLRAALAAQNIDVSHSATLELVAAELGHDNWNVAAAKLDTAPAPNAIGFLRAIPVLRSFDETKAREFYCDFLGFTVDFEHRFEPGLPLYMGVTRAGLTLHLSEHHGDASPGSTVYVPMQGVHALHKELNDKKYGFGRPGIERQAWGDILTVHDPFGNRIRFSQDPAT
ncbi:glyoxalase superfamily protein [Caulobacter soli]|uniref:glyoxalase superfamily protein n=1 Tax=Caulobacter soli TaxID=2708539 RepID=UPI0013EA77E4|nr:glyoxalase superfamily protein [Caulobacter soli]